MTLKPKKPPAELFVMQLDSGNCACTDSREEWYAKLDNGQGGEPLRYVLEEGHQRVLVGVAALVWRGEEILVCKRKGSHGSETWGLPGGHLEHNETPWTRAEIELWEEAGLAMEAHPLNGHVITFFPKEKRSYLTLFAEGTVPLSAEALLREPDKHHEWRWVKPGEIPLPHFGPLANAIDAGILRRSFYAQRHAEKQRVIDSWESQVIGPQPTYKLSTHIPVKGEHNVCVVGDDRFCGSCGLTESAWAKYPKCDPRPLRVDSVGTCQLCGYHGPGPAHECRQRRVPDKKPYEKPEVHELHRDDVIGPGSRTPIGQGFDRSPEQWDEARKLVERAVQEQPPIPPLIASRRRFSEDGKSVTITVEDPEHLTDSELRDIARLAKDHLVYVAAPSTLVDQEGGGMPRTFHRPVALIALLGPKRALTLDERAAVKNHEDEKRFVVITFDGEPTQPAATTLEEQFVAASLARREAILEHGFNSAKAEVADREARRLLNLIEDQRRGR